MRTSHDFPEDLMHSFWDVAHGMLNMQVVAKVRDMLLYHNSKADQKGGDAYDICGVRPAWVL